MNSLQTNLGEAMLIDGATAVALVDYTSGMVLAKEGGAALNLDVAAAGNSDVVRAKLKTMAALKLKTNIEDILITLGDAYHVIRPLSNSKNLFLYVALNRAQANLAMARHKISQLEENVTV